MGKFNDILLAIPKMDLEQLDKLADKIKIARNLLVPEERESEDTDDWLLQGILKELRRRGLLSPKQRPRLAGDLLARYNEWAPGIQEALIQGFQVPRKYRLQIGLPALPEPQPHELALLGSLAAQAMADDLAGSPAPLCLHTMIHALPRALGMVDKSYPGYIAAGMLGMLVRRGGGKKNGARSAAGTVAGKHSNDAGVRRPARGQDRGADQA